MGVPLIQQYRVGRYILGQKLRRVKRYPLVLMLEPLFRCNLACAGFAGRRKSLRASGERDLREPWVTEAGWGELHGLSRVAVEGAANPPGHPSQRFCEQVRDAVGRAEAAGESHVRRKYRWAHHGRKCGQLVS